ncbi:MAG: CshA/CshB family fibrillar adhesin-related protein, partial [Albidovulum sp.]
MSYSVWSFVAHAVFVVQVFARRSVALATLLFLLSMTFSAQVAQAQSNGTLDYPTSGNGDYFGSIAMLDWATSSIATNGIVDGAVVNFPLPGCHAGTLTATFSNLSDPVAAAAYAPTDMQTWSGASMYTAYNGPGTGEALYSINGGDLDFTVNWTMTVGGVSVLPDIFVLDAESTAQPGGEFLGATTNGGPWSLIDQAVGSNYVVSGVGTSSFLITKSEGPSHSPMLLSKGASRTDVTINAGGRQAPAFAVLLPCDYGDADGYPHASHAYFEEPASPIGLQFSPGQPYLGSLPPDSEVGPQDSATSVGDDSDSLGDDEDGVTLPASIAAGSSFNISVASNGGGLVQGWIDWNGDGDFDDANEQIITDGSGGTISVSAPAGAVVGTTFARFRTATASVNSTAVAADGEVEDYQVTIVAVPSVQLTKFAGTPTIAAGANPLITDVGDTVAYTFTVQNTGNVALTNLTISDSIASVAGTLASLAPGASDTATFTGSYTITQTDIDNGGVENTATVSATAPGGVAGAVQ